jgi:hypothetical protein
MIEEPLPLPEKVEKVGSGKKVGDVQPESKKPPIETKETPVQALS